MSEVFEQTIESYHVTLGQCFRTDKWSNIIRVTDETDYSPAQLPCQKPCVLCDDDVAHSEQLHDQTLYGGE